MADETNPANEIKLPQDAARDHGSLAAPATQATPPADPNPIGKKATDLEGLRTAVVDAASVGTGLWFSFLFMLFYFALAVFGVTHRDLFFESPIKLPFLNVELSLIGFFWLGPLFILIVHAYVLLHVSMLAVKIDNFDAELKKDKIADDEAQALRHKLPSNIFVQCWAGPRELRAGFIGFLLWLIAGISLVAAPLMLLVFFELRSLPYHDEWVVWWHRVIIFFDLVLLWKLWPSIGSGKRLRVVLSGLASFATIVLVFCVVTFPGEWLYGFLRSIPVVRTLPDWLVASDNIDRITGKPKRFFSNVLVLPDIDVIDHAKFDTEEKIAAASESISLRGRRLEGAVLLNAHLRKADFTGARLNGAKLSFADLRNADFGCAESEQNVRDPPPTGSFPPLTSQMRCTNLEMAWLIGAHLEGATLSGANIRGARLDFAHLERAKLECVQWAVKPDETPDCAQLQGAVLQDAHLENASLNGAHLEGANLALAHLEGAWLTSAHLEGAWLAFANLQNACLIYADLEGAWLKFAHLMGAELDHTQLQGARLEDAWLDGALLGRVFAWRADVRKARVNAGGQGVSVIGPYTDRKSREGDWTTDSFAKLKQRIEDKVPKGVRLESALKLIANLDPAKPLDGEEEMAKAWVDREKNAPPAATFKSACDR
jgi:uncharacterized protein YjbI with pentapeptide repeats